MGRHASARSARHVCSRGRKPTVEDRNGGKPAERAKPVPPPPRAQSHVLSVLFRPIPSYRSHSSHSSHPPPVRPPPGTNLASPPPMSRVERTENPSERRGSEQLRQAERGRSGGSTRRDDQNPSKPSK